MRTLWALAVGLLAADGTVPPYYHRDSVHLALAEGSSDVDLRDHLREALKRRAVPTVVLQEPGVEPRVLRGLYGVARLNRQAVLGCLSALTLGLRGAELDQVFGTWGGKRVPVTTWWEPDGTLRVAPGQPGFVPFPPGPSAETLIARYGLLPLVDGDQAWNAAARGLLDQALSRLSPEELARVRDVAWHRQTIPAGLPGALTPEGGTLTLGIYRTDRPGPRIEVYDQAFWRGGSFVGEPTAPAPPALWTLLHELGHALAATPVRRGEGPQILPARMAAVRDPSRRLTLYAERDETEAFAEAYAMFHADPAALLRTDPTLHAWFSAGAHLAP